MYIVDVDDEITYSLKDLKHTHTGQVSFSNFCLKKFNVFFDLIEHHQHYVISNAGK